jgi:hypothetical protein
MSEKTIVASFARPDDLLEAVRTVKKWGCTILDVYLPYPIHGLEEELGWRRSWLPAACFLSGTTGVALATWFQFWTTAEDWPLNVGERPWNSLPAFVPVIFETMVLLAGFGLVFAWLWRCGLYPGRTAEMPAPGLTNDRFALMVRSSGALEIADLQRLLHDCHAVELTEHEGEVLS